MCEPMTIMAVTAAASFALSAGGMYMQAQGAADEAEAVNAEANETLRRQYKDLQARRIEENLAKAQQKREVAYGARAAVDAAGMSAAEGGVAGVNVIRGLLRDSGRQTFAIEQNAQFRADQLARDAEGLKAQATARTNQAKRNVPSGLALGLGIASSAVENAAGAYTGGKQLAAI